MGGAAGNVGALLTTTYGSLLAGRDAPLAVHKRCPTWAGFEFWARPVIAAEVAVLVELELFSKEMG